MIEEDSEMWNIDDDVRWIDDGTPTTTMRLLFNSMEVRHLFIYWTAKFHVVKCPFLRCQFKVLHQPIDDIRQDSTSSPHRTR